MKSSSTSTVRTSQVLLAVFIAIVVLEHLLQPGLSPGRHRISEYANSSPGWLMTSGFIAWTAALASAAVATALAPVDPIRIRHFVAALLLLATMGAAANAAFKTGTSGGVVPPGHRLTTANRIHDIGSGGLALVLWVAVLSSLGLSDRRLRARSAAALTEGVVSAVVFSSWVLDLPGINQRALVLVACAWQFSLLAALGRAGRASEHP